jgi:hypothetical protein
MLRFSIREALLLTALAAVAIGWITDHARQAKSNAELTMQCNRLAATKTQLVRQRELL